jgi:plasmid stability protein
MGVHIQVGDVPDAVFLALKARAVRSGRSLSDFLRALLEEAAVTGRHTPVVAPRSADPVAGARD